MASYWFDTWLNEHRVGDGLSLERALSSTGPMTSLVEMAIAAYKEVTPTIDNALVAGRGLDLTFHEGRIGNESLQREIDTLFRRVWHYFDAIVLPDHAMLPVIQYASGKRSGERLIRDLSHSLKILQLIRGVGGIDLVRFRRRFDSCCSTAENLTDCAAGHDTVQESLFCVLDTLASEAKISWNETVYRGHVHVNYKLVHPYFEFPEMGTLCFEDDTLPATADALNVRLAKEVLLRSWMFLGHDLLSARSLKLALGTTLPLYRRLLPQRVNPTISEVAFELDLPVTLGWSVRDLVRFRTEEREVFERFQHALRLAISERVNVTEPQNAADIANEIKRDVIDPELRRVRDRLKASWRFSLETAATGLTLGTATAAIGLLSPLTVGPLGTGVAVGGVIGLGVSGIKKAIEDYRASVKDVSLSDMYFLWDTTRKH